MKKDTDENFVDTDKNNNSLRKFFFIFILLIVLIVIYSRYIATTGIFIKEYPIKSSNITQEFNGFKIAHFSDFHYGRTSFIDELKELVKEINLTKPDMIVFTGDFIDRDINITSKELSLIIEQLKKLDCDYGKYYVIGNHDEKYDKYNEMFDSAGFINLNDNYDIIYNKKNETILLTGLSTNKNFSFLEDVFKDKTYNYKINIMHYPDYFDSIKKYNYDLVLAGHSHDGQIRLPFYGAIITPDNAKKYYKSYYKIDNTDLYISSGIGTSTINFRLFNRPSFNLYRLMKK